MLFGSASRGIPSFGDLAWKRPANLLSFTALPACTYNSGGGTSPSTLTANANGALSINGAAVSVGQRILVVGEIANQARNGIYDVTSAGSAGSKWILTRSSDADTIREMPEGTTILVSGDSVSEGDLVWTLSNTISSFNDNQNWIMLRGPSVSFYRSVAQVIPTGANTNIVFDTQQYGGSAFATLPSANIVIPASFAGIYHVTAAIDFAANAVGNRLIAILLNGVPQAGQTYPTPAGNTCLMGVDADLLCQAGDVISVRVFQNSGGNLNSGVVIFDTLGVHFVKG